MVVSGDLVATLGDWSVGAGPLYRKLADALAGAAADGVLLPGELLPAERRLAAALAVSRATVVAAYDELRGRGVLESRQGSGTRVCAGLPAPPSDGRVRGGRGHVIFQRMIDGPGGDLISLTCAAKGGAQAVAEALDEVAREDLPALLADPGYHPRGLPALRAAIATHYTAGGLPTSDEEVLVTTGAHQALVLVADLYLAPRRCVVVEAPSWPGCIDVFQAAGARLRGVPLDAEGVEPSRLATALADEAPSLLYVMPTYHNPTGVLMSADRRRRVGELAARHRVPVVEDNAYAGLAGTGPDGRVPAPLAVHAPAGAEVLTVDSLGKSVWGGLRTGWVRAPRHIVDRLARRKALADLGSPVLDQALAARLLPRIAELTARRSAELTERLALLELLLRRHLPDWSWTRPAGGSALWVRLPGGLDAGTFAQVALRHGVEIVPGSAMDPDGGHDDHLRIPFTFEPEVLTALVRGLVGAAEELARHGPRDDRPLRPVV